jgi:hypothetical protein
MSTDALTLENCPDFVSVGSLLKATPATEGGRRILYFEASNEGLDQQNEVIAAKALAESADYFLRYGNIDIDHMTLIGAKAGIPDYTNFEIGRPLEVGQKAGKTFVKSEIYSGSGQAAEKANMVWSGLTEISPPQRWYPSVGGAVLAKSVQVDPKTLARKSIVGKVRWSNIGISKTPVNQHVAECATMPLGVFAKSFSVAGNVFNFSKALEAGYGSDSAGLTGGGALREQSLDHGVKNYWDFRNKLAGAMRSGEAGENPKAASLLAYAVKEFGLSQGDAAGYVERFMRDLHSELKKGKAA